jgi:hypothetical protein
MRPKEEPTVQNATPPNKATDHPTFGEMLMDVLDLGAGLAIVLLPLWLIAVPGFMLVIVPAVLLLLVAALPIAIAGAILTPPYLLVRLLRRRRRGAA